MKFLAPIMLLFALTIPVVIALYLLKLKRQVRVVSSTFLWRRFLLDSRANAPFQKLRRNLLLLLQILILLLAVFALARPFFPTRAKPSAFRIVLLDASASMQSADVPPSRFEAAKSQAIDLANSLRDTDRMMVILVGSQPSVICPATSSREELRRVIRVAQPQDTGAAMEDAWRLAVSLARDQPDTEAHLFSDGAFTLAPDLATHLPLKYHPVGARARNVGITGLEVRRASASSAETEIFLAVENASDTPMHFDAELYFNDQLVAVRPLAMKPSEEQTLVAPLNNPSGGLVKAVLRAQDDLAVDNIATVVSRPARRPTVLLASVGNSFLERALAVQRDFDLTRIAPARLDKSQHYDIIVLDDTTPDELPSGNLLLIRTSPKDMIEIKGSEKLPVISDVKAGHPLTRFVQFDNVDIAQSLQARLPDWGVPVVESKKSPLIIAGQHGLRRIVWIGFSLLESNWPLRLSFPIFISNALRWLDPASDQDRMLQVRTGQTARLPLSKNVTTFTVETPDGRKLSLELPPKAQEIAVSQTDRAGVYRVKAGEQSLQFCANLLNAEETRNKPREKIEFGKYQVVEGGALQASNLEIWRWLALSAFAVLLGEWWYYHRIAA
ncbi:MAG: BatA domain-containing protein [Verrucomicrobia bacterium]|nr:BatA domain-containing protein [Verrucomicrobiota bacterium]